MTGPDPKARTVQAESLTVQEFALLFVDPPIRSQRDLVERSGLSQPRVSDVLRGVRIYPAGLARIRAALGGISDELLSRLLENAARVAASKGPRR